jgi:hypothetical protein
VTGCIITCIQKNNVWSSGLVLTLVSVKVSRSFISSQILRETRSVEQKSRSERPSRGISETVEMLEK